MRGSRAIPLGFCRSKCRTVTHVSPSWLHANILSMMWSIKYRFPVSQSMAILSTSAKCKQRLNLVSTDLYKPLHHPYPSWLKKEWSEWEQQMWHQRWFSSSTSSYSHNAPRFYFPCWDISVCSKWLRHIRFGRGPMLAGNNAHVPFCKNSLKMTNAGLKQCTSCRKKARYTVRASQMNEVHIGRK